MLDRVYNWKRFWCPREGHINLSDRGYLYDPDSEWGHIYNPDTVQFESINEAPCLVLLGEPGIGKTHALQAERDAIDVKIGREGGRTHWLDLHSYGDENRLVRDLFECETFHSWSKGDHVLHVFLDSLDECLLRIDNLAALLVDELQKYPVERLRLRIACRTADWPNTLEAGLRDLWGNDDVAAYELAPLRRVDVLEAAETAGLDKESFLEEIDRKEIVALAIKPVTLNLLINIFSRNNQFPSTQAELYRQGCLLLCEETSESRRGAKRIGNLSASQRMTVGARIAAITVFSARFAVWTGVDRGDVPEVDVTINQILGGTESIDGQQFEVTDTAIKETLATGIFSSRGPNRMGWAHQTYAEFLAAWYLHQHDMTFGQLMSLIVSPGDSEGKLIPQLLEVSAWLAGMEAAVFREIMDVEPPVLLRSDVATADVKERFRLVETLLKQFDEESLSDHDWDLRRRYRKLAHPGLIGQLQPYICDQSKGIVVRRVATDMAEACELRSLQGDLANVALDPSDELLVRVNAAYAVMRIGDDETKARLKPLATGQAGEDPSDELRGCGLMAVWPDSITAIELFTAIIPAKRPNFGGAYLMFLASHLMPHLQLVDLPDALHWVEDQLPKHRLKHSFENLVDEIMHRAWEHLETPGVLEAFAKAALSRLNQHDQIFGTRGRPRHDIGLSENDGKRRQVLETVVPMIQNSETDASLLVFSHTPLALTRDVPWMIERLHASPLENIQWVWAELISRAFDMREQGHPDLIIEASQESQILRERFAEFLNPVILDSIEAQDMRERHRKRQEWLHLDDDSPLLDPPPTERIAGLLDEFEAGNLAAFWRLNMEMTLEPNDTIYGDELQSDLTSLPGWQAADPATRDRIVKAAKRYLSDANPDTDKWLGTNIIHGPAFAGYRALRLLEQEDPRFVSAIPPVVWIAWAPIIIRYPTNSGIAEVEPDQLLVNMAYQYAPTEVIKTLMTMIDKDNNDLGDIFIVRKVIACLDERLANALLLKAKEEDLKEGGLGSLLGPLLDYGLVDARVFAESLLLDLPHSDPDRQSRAVAAARSLLTHTHDAGWEVVWPAIQQNAEFGQSLISAIATRDDRGDGSITNKLAEDQLADFYIWVVRQYPHEEDPPLEGGFVNNRTNISWWRDSLLSNLQRRGTNQACDAIRRIANEMPEYQWLKFVLQDAQHIARSRTWVPPQPEHILKLARHPQSRLVASEHQLLEVLIESLRRLEMKLHGENPACEDIWDKVLGENTYRPKAENLFSDYVKRHLDEDIGRIGIVVNREVEIHRGQRTDIHVNAVVPGHDELYGVVTVIIEVKGCWHRDLNNAMETQLLGRYLKENSCQHGIYLVGWFNCDMWDDNDPKKRRATRRSVDEAQQRFDAQAQGLSHDGTQIKAFVMDTAFR